MKKSRLLVAIACAMGLAACSEQDKGGEDPSVAVGEKLFQENCSECHPRTGRGDYLKRIPATLLTRKSQSELMAWIKGTDQHREMPAFDHLSDDERAALANYLESQILK
ncbi:MAG: cytochrome c [Gammaproteobacteria bacterium]|nr:MAG: cytochrome c [Gammaproteobacteria bacterium]